MPDLVDCPNGCDADIGQFLHIPVSLQLKRRLEDMYYDTIYMEYS